MSVTRNHYPWIVVGLGLLLFVVLPLVRKVEGGKRTVDLYEGTWGGHMTFSIDDPKFWDRMPGPHRDAVLYFTLDGQQDDANGYYGPGEIYFAGAEAPQPVYISKFRPSKDGSVDLRFDLKNVLYLMLNGNIKDGSLTLQSGDADAPTMKAELKRGTEADFKKMLADVETHSAPKP